MRILWGFRTPKHLKKTRTNGFKPRFWFCSQTYYSTAWLQYSQTYLYSYQNHQNSIRTLNKVGTIDPDGQHHMHISISDAEGAVHGGHVFSEHIIYTTGEFESTSKAIKTIQPKSLSGPMTTNIIAVKTALLVDGPSWSLQKSVNKVHKKAESSLSFFLYFAFVYSRLAFVYCNSNCAFKTATWLFRHWFSDR